jgi:GxxExxY protein
LKRQVNDRTLPALAEFLLDGWDMNDDRDPLTERIIGCAIEVHRLTGPGLLESVYDFCLAIELQSAGLAFERHLAVPFEYKTHSVRNAFNVDYVVERRVVVELKAVETILPVHRAQVLTYMKLTQIQTGLLLNFNATVMRDGIRRLIWTPATAAET